MPCPSVTYHILSVCTSVIPILYYPIYGGELRCLATFGLTEANIMDDDTDISGEKWDVYSLAVVLSFLFSEQHPYSGLRNNEIVHRVLEDGLRPETAGMEPRLTELVSRMWSAEPADRPSAAKVARDFADGVT